ncbi:bifunctional diaminohydroxyphosphoribosylaminopyrimidine deaminase/5-amino-6-(5-phosphoribosylamino)uracil reductase RibD [Magnetovirga frankeli]|nr:bifunctional diaminohydroxyphosphoribosylaminopyrimidine deaminase/5-amino-6-(5-phosphoribosylamino)uracil reductase RibD [gamma proteobacterium SS-5]
MARAIRLAELGLYTTDPNPRVGCVLVRDGQVVGEGFHRRAGEPHAERLALAQAGEWARGATAYVSLEPCSHFGRTPPCADGLIEAGVARVVAAMQDPNPLVAGQGLERLRQAGIQVESGLLEGQARALNPGFNKRMQQGLPWVRCKLAMSLDGRTAMASGESQWITGPEARQDVQRWRARSSAILTGSGTLLADDPSLNVRLSNEQLHQLGPDYPVRQPLRVLLDSHLRTPTSARLLGLPGETLILYADASTSQAQAQAEALRRAGAVVRQVATSAQGLDLEQSLRLLAQRGINEIWVEAGATLSGALLQAGLVDELILYMAPKLMGDAARGLLHLPGLERMAQCIPLEYADIRRVGRDLRFVIPCVPV